MFSVFVLMRSFRPATVCLLALILAGVATAQELGSEYRVGARDLLEIRVEEDPSLNTTDRVGVDGRFPMPLIGPVFVDQLTPAEIERTIAALLGERYITNPTVTVVVREFESEAISVFGEVRKPGRIPATADMRLLQAITAAGGLTNNHAQHVQVLRVASSGLTDQVEISLRELMEEGNPDVNIPLRADDVINIPTDPEISINLLGEVMKQGVLKFKASEGVTLLQAIAAAGGLTDRAVGRSIVILRKSPRGEQERLVFNLNSILAGRNQDPKLEHGDTIHVKESFF